MVISNELFEMLMLLNQSFISFFASRKLSAKGAVFCCVLLFLMPPLAVLAGPLNNLQAPLDKARMQAMKVTAGNALAGFSISPADSLPIIEYYRNISMLKEQDAQPMLQVYADGRVRVHTPVYMKNAGDYEYQLSQAELVALVRTLSKQGVMDFDRERVHRDKKTHDSEMKQKGELHYVSDSMETVVDIRLKNYQRTAKSLSQADFKKRFSWKNLEQDARHYKNNRSIQSADLGIKELDKLLHHPSMKRVK